MKKTGLLAEIRFFSALAEPCRLEILGRLLMHGAMDVSSLAQGMTQDFSVISRHCNILYEAELITRRKDGRRTIYEPTEIVVTKLKAITAQLESLLKKRAEK